MAREQADSTALTAALVRAAHLLVDDEPKVLRDDFAGWLAGFDSEAAVRAAIADREAAVVARLGPELGQSVFRSLRSVMTVRNRYAEDLLTEALTRGTGQYVLLGAGLDSFAYRRRDLGAALRVFEVDRPGTQSWKRARLEERALAPPDNLTYVPVDFERQSLRAALEAAGYRPDAPGFFSWLGVTQYLTEDATQQTLRELAGLAAGAELIMEYTVPLALLAGEDQQYLAAVSAIARAQGAPWQGFYEPGRLVGLARSLGFTRVTAVSPADLNDRYFAGRRDGLRTPQAHQFLHAGRG